MTRSNGRTCKTAATLALAALAVPMMAFSTEHPNPGMAAAGADGGSSESIGDRAVDIIANLGTSGSTLADGDTGNTDGTGETDAERQVREDLEFTLEEERMARDLYTALGRKWPNARPFQNIPRSEQQHMNLVVAQMDRLGIEHDVENTVPGVFRNPEIQALYDGWLARGLTTQREAFVVGKELEERDIADIEAVIARTEDPQLAEMYEKLLQGSRNHLAAFERQLAGGGGGGGQGGHGGGGGQGGHGGGWQGGRN